MWVIEYVVDDKRSVMRMFEGIGGGVVCLVCFAILGTWVLLLWIGSTMEELKNGCFRFMFKPLLPLDDELRERIKLGIRSGLEAMFVEGEAEYMLVDKRGDVYTPKNLDRLKRLVEIFEAERKRMERDEE